jgi:hypothetical protein
MNRSGGLLRSERGRQRLAQRHCCICKGAGLEQSDAGRPAADRRVRRPRLGDLIQRQWAQLQPASDRPDATAPFVPTLGRSSVLRRGCRRLASSTVLTILHPRRRDRLPTPLDGTPLSAGCISMRTAVQRSRLSFRTHGLRPDSRQSGVAAACPVLMSCRREDGCGTLGQRCAVCV